MKRALTLGIVSILVGCGPTTTLVNNIVEATGGSGGNSNSGTGASSAQASGGKGSTVPSSGASGSTGSSGSSGASGGTGSGAGASGSSGSSGASGSTGSGVGASGGTGGSSGAGNGGAGGSGASTGAIGGATGAVTSGGSGGTALVSAGGGVANRGGSGGTISRGGTSGSGGIAAVTGGAGGTLNIPPGATVACGAAVPACPVSTGGRCCYNKTAAEYTCQSAQATCREELLPNNASIFRTSIVCDGAEDCMGGDICCLEEFYVVSRAYCMPRSACVYDPDYNPTPAFRHVLCDPTHLAPVDCLSGSCVPASSLAPAASDVPPGANLTYVCN